MKHLKRSKSGTQVKSHGCVPDVKIGAIGQFRVPKTLTSKMRLGAQPFLWKWVLFAWESKMISISKAEHLPSFWKRGLGGLGNGLVVLKVVHLAFVMELRGLHRLQPPTPIGYCWHLKYNQEKHARTAPIHESFITNNVRTKCVPYLWNSCWFFW